MSDIPCHLWALPWDLPYHPGFSAPVCFPACLGLRIHQGNFAPLQILILLIRYCQRYKRTALILRGIGTISTTSILKSIKILSTYKLLPILTIDTYASIIFTAIHCWLNIGIYLWLCMLQFLEYS